MHYLLIDGSYWIFYRFYAIKRWIQFAHKDINVNDENINLFENELFLTKFKDTFISKMKEIVKKLKIPNETEIIIGKDCHRKDIWRHQFYNNYKGNRDDSFEGGSFFKISYPHKDESGEHVGLFNQCGISKILKHPKLEADDCIALFVRKYILNTDNTCTIITGDHDYLQLNYNNVDLVTLKMKPLGNDKNSTGDPKKDLIRKIIEGDKSDNIMSVFKKCGKKTSLKLCNNLLELTKKMEKENCMDKYMINKKIIDFNEIPQKLVDEFYCEY